MGSFNFMKCVIVDDEPHCVQYLEKYIGNIDYLHLEKSYTDPLIAAKEIMLSKIKIDILFLDIDMDGMSGLELAEAVRHKVRYLVFVTSHAKYSLKAYEVLCNQYLLKPFTQESFTSSVEKLYQDADPPLSNAREDFIFIKSARDGKFVKINHDEIISVNGMEHYVTIHTLNDRYVQYTKIKDVEISLSHNKIFLRVHKSHIISKKHIKSIQGSRVILCDNQELNIGSTYKKDFTAFVSSNLLA